MFRRSKKGDNGSSSSSSGRPLDVMLIGCGPGGMMFLHALNRRRKAAEGGDDAAAASSLPNVTCFERASGPGGLWRDVPNDDSERKRPENAALMYDDLWSNTPKELMEFSDYTFDDHFQKPTPSFLPRKDLLEYLVARNSVDGALDSVKFNHTVQSVTYDDSEKKFVATVRDDASGETSTSKYDKCVWAAGLHGSGLRPPDVLEVLEPYTGKIMHSCEATENFANDVEGKKVLMIGDSSSGEDLALRAAKLGAKHVYVCARSGEGDASETKAWPKLGGKDRVTVIFGPPYKCLKGTGFKCQAVYWSEKKQRYRRDDDEEPVKIKDIDTVVLCTGYNENLSVLDDSLQFDDEEEWEISKGWNMDNNALTITLGNVTPSKHLGVGNSTYIDVYRGLLISNPSMMYVTETQESPSGFWELDVAAHLALGYLTGEVPIPKEKDMVKANRKQLEGEMQVPWLRMHVDRAYADEINELENHWSENGDDERVVVLNRMASGFLTRRLARDMKDAKYPVDFGDHKKLNKTGERFVDMLVDATKCRTELHPNDDGGRATFRDAAVKYDFASLHTGTKSTGLPGRWMDLKVDEGEDFKLANVK